MFELTNEQRKYFGLEPVEETWDRVQIDGFDSIIYFDGNVIKKKVNSSDNSYIEKQYNEETEDRKILLPKTKKGKPKQLTPNNLTSRSPIGVYLSVQDNGSFTIGNYTTQKTFYTRYWEDREKADMLTMIQEFIEESPNNHFEEIEKFRIEKRKRVTYKAGDFFAFKLNRSEYGFGRILFDINKARKKKLIQDNHGLYRIMGPPVLIKMYMYKSTDKKVDLDFLKKQKAFPSDYIMDNNLFYGEYEIIGSIPLEMHELEFPISYGKRIDRTPNVFLQWGLIHQELPLTEFDAYITGINKLLPEDNNARYMQNPYGYYGISFSPRLRMFEMRELIHKQKSFNFISENHYGHEWDLRNPKNEKIREEIFLKFGLDPSKSYEENCKITRTRNITEVIEEMK